MFLNFRLINSQISKKKHKIKKYKQHDEFDNIQRIEIETKFVQLRIKLLFFHMNDVYNMNETKLFWKTCSDVTLITKQLLDEKFAKTKITINMCCNCIETNKLSIWYIEMTQNFRIFDFADIHVDNLHMIWRYNKKNWMTIVIFREYLRWFDN